MSVFKLQLLGRRRFHIVFEFGASVAVVSPTEVTSITSENASTVVLVET